MESPCLELVNSEVWYGLGPLEDLLLGQPGWLDGFVSRWELSPTAGPTNRQLAELVRLRSLLRRLVDGLAAGQSPTEADLRELNAFLASRPVSRQVARTASGHRMELVPARRDWRWVLSEIAASFGGLLSTGETARIKVCQNPECRWAFYDESKNRKRRWCDPAICGNRDKVRRFRSRQQADRTR